MPMEIQKPNWVHEGTWCTFLGTYEEGTLFVDLYLHETSSGELSDMVTVRYSDYPGDQTSWPLDVESLAPEIKKAQRLSKQLHSAANRN
jgi:hypothetical protein